MPVVLAKAHELSNAEYYCYTGIAEQSKLATVVDLLDEVQAIKCFNPDVSCICNMLLGIDK